jgi:ribonuclease HII
MVSHRIIDRLNVNGATEYALNKLLRSLPMTPDIVLLDGNYKFQCDVPVRTVTRGDSLSLSIASASIMAKVNRDAVMEKMDERFPGYGIGKNKGYGTGHHMLALRNRGFSPIHRRSYDPVKTMLRGRGDEG